MFDWIEELMEATGCDWETAAREYMREHDPDYCADDYDCPDEYHYEEPYEDYDMGFDPYMGCYTDDC